MFHCCVVYFSGWVLAVRTASPDQTVVYDVLAPGGFRISPSGFIGLGLQSWWVDILIYIPRPIIPLAVRQMCVASNRLVDVALKISSPKSAKWKRSAQHVINSWLFDFGLARTRPDPGRLHSLLLAGRMSVGGSGVLSKKENKQEQRSRLSLITQRSSGLF